MAGVRRGHWTEQEDALLRHCIETTGGEGKWHQVPLKAGLNRCRKSCRLRWLNYLKPNIKRGEFSMDEDDLIIRLHKLLGNRWSLIAGRVPGRTANDVKNHWNTHLRKKTMLVTSRHPTNAATVYQTNVIYKPRPLTFSKSLGQPFYAGHMNNNVLISNAERNNNNNRFMTAFYEAGIFKAEQSVVVSSMRALSLLALSEPSPKVFFAVDNA
ncbi:unnamed protein product [Rhodiola kirilowii]